MAVNYTTASLIEKTRTIGAIPSSSSNFTDQKLVTIANDEMQSTVVPLIMMAKQEYYVTYEDFEITSTSEPTIIPIPHNAIYDKIADITLAQTVNGVVNELSIPNIARETLTAGPAYSTIYYQNVFGYTIQDSNIIFYPGVYVNLPQNYIRLYFYRRPLELVTTANAGRITAITGNDLTLSQIPASWTIGDDMVAVSQLPPFRVKGYATITAISNPVVTVDDASLFAVGDWISLDGYCPIPMIPVEAMSYLIACTVLRVHEAMADDKMTELATLKKKELGAILINSITPRTDGERQVIQKRYSIGVRGR